MVVRKINEKKVGIDTAVGTGFFLTHDDLVKSGLDKMGCSLRSVEKYLKGDSKVIPLEVTWEITNRCNLNCDFCYIHNHSNGKSISFDEAKPYMDEMIANGLLRATITGGECMMNPDFLKIYRYFKKAGVLVDVYTNGTMFTPEVWEVFKELPPNCVEITMYNSYENNPDPFDNAMKLKNMGIGVIVKFTVAKTTIEHFEGVKKWCEENKQLFKFDTDIFDAYDDSETSSFTVTEDEKVRIDKMKIKFENSNPRNSDFTCFSCGAGNVSFHINSNFEIGLCAKDPTRYPLIGDTFENAYYKMISVVYLLKGMEYKGCTKGFCEKTQSYYKKLCDENNTEK